MPHWEQLAVPCTLVLWARCLLGVWGALAGACSSAHSILLSPSLCDTEIKVCDGLFCPSISKLVASWVTSPSVSVQK